MNPPKQTSEVFELLSKGQFICSNSSRENIRRLYMVVDERFDELHDYFLAIDFILARGDEFFYFTRTESKIDLERKIEAAYKWIDIMDFLKTFDSSFSAGYRFTPSDILVRLNVDALLKNKLEGLKKYSAEDSYAESIRKILRMLCNDNFLELENEISDSYKALSSFRYLEQLIMSINIPEEANDEIPR
jgi:hypothetical protein